MQSIIHFFANLVINADIYLQFVIILGLLLAVFTKWNNLSRRLIICASIPFFIISLSPLSRYGFIQLENRYPRVEVLKDDFFGFILLGGSINKYLTTNRGGDKVVYGLCCPRLIEFADIAKKHPNKPIIFTGTPDEVKFEIQTLIKIGIDESRFIPFPNATNTVDNAINTYKAYQPKPDQKFILVTSAFHMPRSMGLFQTAGWNVEAYPVDYRTIGSYEKVPPLVFIDRLNFIGWHFFTKEWECMLNNYINGHSKVFFPGPVKH